MTRILDAHEHPLPQPVKPSGHIRQHGRESEIDDAVAHYRVHGDGTVSIENKKDIDLHWKIHIPTPSRILRFVHDVGREVGDWYEDPYRDAHVGTTSELPAHLQAVPGSCSSWGDPMCDADAPVKITKPMDGSKGGTIPVLGGGMDITSWLYRKYVGDPYSSRKLKMLDETRAERAQAGAVHRADQLARSAELMTRNLEALWRATGDPALRRRALFELWDECTEGKSSAGQAGERARAMVIGWIRAKLPAGSAGAFTADEITRLDAHRTSKQHFTPYD
jgi:hypothetical protein